MGDILDFPNDLIVPDDDMIIDEPQMEFNAQIDKFMKQQAIFNEQLLTLIDLMRGQIETIEIRVNGLDEKHNIWMKFIAQLMDLILAPQSKKKKSCWF